MANCAKTESPPGPAPISSRRRPPGSPSPDTMLEKLAVATRTRMRYTQSHEELFSLLDLTENTTMRLPDATLDQKLCELFTRLYLGGEQYVCGERMMVGFFDSYPAFSRMGVRRLPRIICLRSLATTHTQPAPQSSDVGLLGGQLLAARATRSGRHGIVCAPGVISLFEALDSVGNTTVRLGETCERRLPTKQNSTTRRRMPS